MKKDYITTSGEILNLTGDDFESLKNDFEVYLENGDFYEASINKDLLRYKGFALSDEYMRMLLSLAVIIIVIIAISSIFCYPQQLCNFNYRKNKVVRYACFNRCYIKADKA